MSFFRNFIKNTFVPTKNAIHDCVDTGATLALLTGVEVDLPVDSLVRNYKSTDSDLWFPASSLVKDTIDDTEIRVKMKLTVNGSINGIVLVKCFVPHPTFGDILIDEQDIVLYKNNIDINATRFFMLYNGIDSDAKTYGFKFTLTPSANIDLKARSILVSI